MPEQTWRQHIRIKSDGDFEVSVDLEGSAPDDHKIAAALTARLWAITYKRLNAETDRIHRDRLQASVEAAEEARGE
tara:strand:+ start:259 stop:486 length:228 start_codon:yes stop_codon:yes gene_type:complete